MMQSCKILVSEYVLR